MPTPCLKLKSEWPPNYIDVWTWRQNQIIAMRKDPNLVVGALEYYKTRPVEFICHWVDTYDPRLAMEKHRSTKMPFILFKRQAEMIDFLQAMIEGKENGLCEKCRDVGATWICVAFSVWLFLFVEGASVGWGSRKEALVDKIGDADSIFEKARMILRTLPREFLPIGFTFQDHVPFMRIINPANGATITGEAGDNIGRGGRKLIYFKDESAHYERPEKIEAALADNTNTQIDISSVNGIGNVFHRKREAGVEWEGGEAHEGKTNVFIIDWSDHPEKDQAWFDARRVKAEDAGLLHVFAQEVERNYAASVDGVIIPHAWVTAAVDAHLKLGLPEPEGLWICGQDVADEGRDKNAQAIRKSYLLTMVDDWARGDTGETTRRCVANAAGYGVVEINYDCIGVGAGVKAESNRLAALPDGSEDKLPSGLTFVPWNAGSSIQFPDEHLIPDDDQTPINKDYYASHKSQAWMNLRIRFEKTFRFVTEGVYYPAEELISLPSTLPKLQQLKKELSQATMSRSTSTYKLLVDKSPEGTRSPNLADSVVMAFWPITDLNEATVNFLMTSRHR